MLCLPQQLHSPTTVSSKTWLILGLVDTWHSKSPASEAFVNLSLSVFWPRLRWRTLRLLNVLYKIYKFLQPARHELEPLVVDVFLFSNKQWISVAGSHPGNLGRTQSQYRVKRFSLDCHFIPFNLSGGRHRAHRVTKRASNEGSEDFNSQSHSKWNWNRGLISCLFTMG